MFLSCSYCQRFFKREDNRIRETQLSRKNKTPEDVPKVTSATEKHHRCSNEIEFGETFRFKTPSRILIVPPPLPCCFKTIVTFGLLGRIVCKLPSLIATRVWQDGFQDMRDAGVQFHGIPESAYLKSWFPKDELLVLDDLMAEGGEDKELLDLFTRHSHHQNNTVFYLCQNMFP